MSATDSVCQAFRNGWALIPCHANKRPRIKWKQFQTRKPTNDELNAWRADAPACWAVVCGPISGVVVVDFDGPTGCETMEKLALNPHVRTPGGGFHVYLTHPGVAVSTLNGKAKRELGALFPGLDVRGDGGYAIFFGRSEKGSYSLLRPLDPDPWESLPQALRDYLTRPESAPPSPLALLETYLARAREGARNDTGFELACQMRDNGHSRNVAEGILQDYARRVPGSGYTEQEALGSVEQAYSRPGREPWTASRGGGPKPPGGFSLTDLGNSERLICAHGGDLRFDVDAGKWLVWNGAYWQHDAIGKIDRLARRVVRGMYNELKTIEDRGRATELFKHIKTSESRPRLEAMIDLGRWSEGVPLKSSDLDGDPWLLCCKNGVIDLRTGILREHRREDLITRVVEVEYDPNATCPTWTRFLSEVFQEDGGLVEFVQRAAGYALTGDVSEQCFFLLHGGGATGSQRCSRSFEKY